MKHSLRLTRIALFLGLLFAGGIFPFAVSAQSPAPSAALLHIDGVIDPNRAKYLDQRIKRVQAKGASFIILQIDTPGGLSSSMKDMVESIVNAKLPIVTYVYPQGAEAASAGTFIAAAGHVAVMAPVTNIGAASPVNSGGGELPPTLKSKATNDAASRIRAIAELRGRNAEKLEQTVTEAASFTAEEALRLDIVDLIAPNYADLLRQINGTKVMVDGREVVLTTNGIRCDVPREHCSSYNLNFFERTIAVLAHPALATILLLAGALGLFVEISSPGLVAPGVFGAIAIALACIGLLNLPVNWVGVGLILLSVVLLILELHVAGFGALGAGAIVAFVFGAFLLFAPFGADPPSVSMPKVRLSLWFIGGVVITFLAITGGALLLSRRDGAARERIPRERTVVGMRGKVVSALTPTGIVHVAGEDWSAAEINGRELPFGQEVEVRSVEGLVLKVAAIGT